HRDRLREASVRVVVGKMSGAVGTGAAFGPYALDIQPAVMRDLGVGMEEAATQVVGRDRYAEFIAVLANLAASLEKFCTEVHNLRVYPDRMKENLEATRGQVMAEAVMIALVAKGLGRQDAHRLVREAAQKARAKEVHLRDVLLADSKVTKLLSKKDIEAALDPNAYLGESFAVVDAVVKRLR